MFKEWGFLLTEIWVLLIIAALIGLLVGWIIWGRRSSQQDTSAGDVSRLKADLSACAARNAEKDAKLAQLSSDLEDCRAQSSNEDLDGDGKVEGADEGTKPTTLAAARDGKADDLKLIKGVGPKMEKLCNKLGFYHFDQIAAWTPDEVAWVDANLEGFKGRVSRDAWVAQAKTLANAG